MKKSKSSIPLLEARFEEDEAEGLDGIEELEAGARDGAAPDDEEVVRVAMAVGKTKDGSELPANLKEGEGKGREREREERRDKEG